MSFAELAAFERQGVSVDLPTAREPYDILRDLERLEAEPDLTKVKSLTAELAEALKDEKELTVDISREQFLKILDGKLNAPARIFDNALKDARPTQTERHHAGQGQPLNFEDPEPWPQPVDGAELLDDLKAAFSRYVVLGEGADVVLALWTVHTFAFDVAWITPRLAITSPEKRCGKTLVLTLLGKLVAKPLLSANVSPAVLFRCVERYRPTLLIDEADTFLHGKDELRGMLNSGHQQDGSVLRTVGDDHEPRAFATFAPAAIAMIGELPDTLADRSIAICMKRKKTQENTDRLRLDRLGHLEELRRRALRWATDHCPVLPQADPEVPPELHDRAADNWRPLLAIADRAGGHWPRLARAVASKTTNSDVDASVRAQLLEDLRTLLEKRGADRVFSSEIVADLGSMEDRPWSEWRAGKPLSQRQLAKLLQPFGIRPQQVRIDSDSLKGYRRDQFEEAFARYLPPPIRNIRNNPQKSTLCADSGSETPGGSVSDPEEPLEPLQERIVSDVSDRDGESRGDADHNPLREVFEL